MSVERLLRDDSWGGFAEEQLVERIAADVAYLGAQRHYASQLVGRKVTKAKVRSLFRLLSPGRRGMTCGRPRRSRTIERMPLRQRSFLIKILHSYFDAVTLGADPVDAKLAAWKIFDAEREAGLHDIDATSMSLGVWLLFLETLRNRSASVYRCGVCGSAVISVNNTVHKCSGGNHSAVHEAPYFLAEDGGDALLKVVL